MSCKFCGQNKKLIGAHVIPKSFHQIDKSATKPMMLLTDKEGEYARKIPKGVYDKNLVCEDCERMFSPWDDYAKVLLLDEFGKSQPLIHQGKVLAYLFASYDYEKLKLFFISMLWRAHASNNIMFKRVNVGSYELVLKHAVLNANAGHENEFSVCIAKWDESKTPILHPFKERYSGVNFYRFSLSGFTAIIKVDKRPMVDPFDEVMLRPNQQLVVMHQSYHGSKAKEAAKKVALIHKHRNENRG